MELLIEEIKCLIAERGTANRRKRILAIAGHRVNEHCAVLGDRRKTFFYEPASIMGRGQEVDILCSPVQCFQHHSRKGVDKLESLANSDKNKRCGERMLCGETFRVFSSFKDGKNKEHVLSCCFQAVLKMLVISVLTALQRLLNFL